jgi:Co/Zn/Cd efflux system component
VNFTGMRLLGSSGHSHGESHADHNNLQVTGNHKEEHDEYSLSMKSAYLEVLSDTLCSVGVITAGVIILTTRFYLAEHALSGFPLSLALIGNGFVDTM